MRTGRRRGRDEVHIYGGIVTALCGAELHEGADGAEPTCRRCKVAEQGGEPRERNRQARRARQRRERAAVR